MKFFRRAKSDHERIEELESYIQIETDANIARGMLPDEARSAARRKLGNSTLVREQIYNMSTISLFDSLGRDLRYAMRGLMHNPAFTVVAVLTLALGIGANTAIFSVVNGVLIKPLSYPAPEQLITVSHSAVFQGATIDNMSLSPTMYVTYRDRNQTFQNFGVWSSAAATVTGTGDPEQVRAIVVTQGLLPALAVKPELGRWFSPADDTPGTPETVILTYGYWQRRFGGAAGIIGHSINIDGRPRIVIGVMPQEFRFVNRIPELILPQRFASSGLRSDSFNYFGIARLKRGVTLEQARTEAGRVLPEWADTFKMTRFLNSVKVAPAPRPLKEEVVGDIGNVLWVLTGTIGFVLLVACANLANLMLVRAEGRRHELAIRAALGAGWSRIARELLAESSVLALFGGALGLGLAYGALQLLLTLRPRDLPRLSEVAIDPAVLVFTMAVSLVSGLLFGLLPVVRHAGPAIAAALRGGQRTASLSRERHRFQGALVVVQVALALVLLVASGLMIRTFLAMRGVQPGFARAEQVQTVHISIPEAEVREPERVIRMQQDIIGKITTIPGVASAAFTTALPMEFDFHNMTAIAVEGQVQPGVVPPIRRTRFVSPGLLKTLETPLIAGRDFDWTDVYGEREVALVSEKMARASWGEPANALGKRIRIGSDGPWREVIGVIGDIYDNGIHQPAPPMVLWRGGVERYPWETAIRREVAFTIRTDRAGTESFVRELQQAVWSVNPNLALASLQTLGDLYRQSMARTSLTLVMLGIAGAMALLMGVVGIYGVISYAVSQRRREAGIRLALGAQQGQLQRMFVGRGLVLSGIGVMIGSGAAFGLTRLLKSLLFGVGPWDPVTYAAVAITLVVAAALASYLPARRASAVDPLEALRAE